MSTTTTTEGGGASGGSGKDLTRAVAFLTLPKVQRTPESARVSFLQGKGFTAEEIAEAQRQANEILEKRKAEGGAGSSTFGSAGGGSSTSANLPWPLTRMAAPGGEGGMASARVTVGGLGFVSLVSEDGPASDDGEAAAAALLGRLEAGKEDVAVVMLVVGPGQGTGAHRALDAWVDPAHLPVRQVVEQGGQEGAKKAQLFAVVRAR